jgi:hypothetical protein
MALNIPEGKLAEAVKFLDEAHQANAAKIDQIGSYTHTTVASWTGEDAVEFNRVVGSKGDGASIIASLHKANDSLIAVKENLQKTDNAMKQSQEANVSRTRNRFSQAF